MHSHNKVRFTKTDKNTFIKITNNILSLIKNDIKVVLRINYTSKHESELEELVEYICNKYNNFKNNFIIDFQRVWQDRDSLNTDDSTEQTVNKLRDYLRNSNYLSPNNSTRKHISMPCYGDLYNYLLINYNGELFGCTARDFITVNSIGVLTESGTPNYNNLYSRRRIAKFSKSVCKSCRIAPLCGGGCRQKALELFQVRRLLWLVKAVAANLPS